MSKNAIHNLEYIISIIFWATINSYFFYLKMPLIGIAILLMWAYFRLYIVMAKAHKAKMLLMMISTHSHLLYIGNFPQYYMSVVALENMLSTNNSLELDLIAIEIFRHSVIDSHEKDKNAETVVLKILHDLDKYLELKYFFCKQRIKILHRRKLNQLLND